MKVISKIPSTQKLAVTLTTPNGVYKIASITNSGEYVIYRECGGKLEQLGKGKNPLELENKFCYEKP